MKIKSFLITAVLVTAIFGFGTGVNAQVDTQALIAQLQAQIHELILQITQLQNTTTTPLATEAPPEDPTNPASVPDWCHTFNTNLRIEDGGMDGGARAANTIDNDVVALKQALAKEGLYNLDIDRPGTAGSSIKATIFHEQLASAVVEFQEKYVSEILAPYGLTRGTGYVGKSTRAKLNALYGCGITPTQPSITVTSPNGGETLIQGQIYPIQWKPSNELTGLQANIDLYTSDNILVKRIGSFIDRWYEVDNVSGYKWAVGSDINLGSKYLLKIYYTNTSGQITASDFSDNYFSITAPTTACTDSDNMDYFTKGTVTWLATGNIATDYCINTNTLAEYQCAGATSSAILPTQYTCPNGCENGACKKLPVASSSAPVSVGLNASFQIKCDYGIVLPCIAPTHGENGCSFVKFDGTTAIFNCIASKSGLQDNYCKIFYYAGDSRCLAPQQDKIQSTDVTVAVGINNSQDALASISDAIARIIQGIQDLLKK